MRRTALLIGTVLALGASTAGAQAATWRTIWRLPGALTHVAVPGDKRTYGVLQDGRIFAKAPHRARLFLDIRGRVHDSGEQGLLSMAFHPQFLRNGRFFVYYNESTHGDIEVDEWRARGGHVIAGSRRLVIRIGHREADNHNGGQLQFGPDGYLWLGTGDGGGGGDGFGHAQDHSSLLGKLLRIDVDGARPYAIPPSNPFAHGGGRPEIWAIGIRNPWRFSFDRVTGKLWIGDVGQDAWEEIDAVTPHVSSGFLNFGWGRFEGLHLYNPNRLLTGGALVRPIAEYSHSSGSFTGDAIIGGYVYRGPIVKLRGTYIYGDDGGGWIRGRRPGGRDTPVWDGIGPVTSFGQNRRGDLFAATGDGRVLRLVR